MGILRIVATPIGNLEDITLRAIRVLKESAIVFCEDTRVTKKLFDKYEIRTPLARLDAHTEKEKTLEVIAILSEGKNVAYVSDSGTPGISDPGSRLISHAREIGVKVEAIPGASALTAAISISGLSETAFTFLGFLPHKKGRATLLKEISQSRRTIVVYESTHRIMKLLSELASHCPLAEIIIARELTKIHEEVLSGSPEELFAFLSKLKEKQRGEFVVIIRM